jgi:hypothetical protein
MKMLFRSACGVIPKSRVFTSGARDLKEFAATLVIPRERRSCANEEPVPSLPREPERATAPRVARSARSKKRDASILVSTLLLSSLAISQTLTGTVKNATTGKPAAGDEVVLLKLGEGMEESGRTKTDAKGNFSFKLDEAQSPHLVRAIHQEVTYHRMAPPGTTSVELEVYDVGRKVEGIQAVADVMWIQIEKGQLEVIRKFAVQNTSKPPRTQMNDRNFEFYLPEGAQIVEGTARTENGQPLKSAPVQEREKTRYAFIFPLRPGTTEFTVAYQLPYTGSTNLDPKPIYPLQHFVAIVPKSMQFFAAPGTNFKAMENPNQPDANTEVTSTTTPGQSLAFKISGEGLLQQRTEAGGEQGQPAASETRPGGGLGPPIDAPDPLQKYRWYILGGFALILAAGAVYVASRQQATNRATVRSVQSSRAQFKLRSKAPALEDDELDYDEPQPSAGQPPFKSRPVADSAQRASPLLDALKEELFQLEVDRKQGNISQQEYENAKSALDLTLERALKREAQKT